MFGMMPQEWKQRYVDESMRSQDKDLRKLVQREINEGRLPQPTWAKPADKDGNPK